MKEFKIHPSIIYMIILLYLEVFAKLIMAHQVFNLGSVYMVLFSIPIVILLSLLTKVFEPKINKTISIVLVLIITLLFEIQYVYFTLFSVPFSFSSIGMADQALDFITIIKDTLLKYWYNIIAIMAPFIVFCINKVSVAW